MNCCIGDTVLCITFGADDPRQEGEHKSKLLLFGFYLGFFAGLREMDFKFYLTFIVEEKQEGNRPYSFWGRKQRREG